ncbi:MAG: hypothetical protein JNL12_15370 [Planctomycetes bacterium]|nr:hypothetical protein [Planctomycetota bacterium]
MAVVTAFHRRGPAGVGSPRRPTLPLVGLLSWFLASACVGFPECAPGVTRRTDVLLALGEPVLALDGDRVLVHVWQRYTDARIPARWFYRRDAVGLRRLGVDLPATSFGASTRAGTLSLSFVVHEFDEQGLLLRRLP